MDWRVQQALDMLRQDFNRHWSADKVAYRLNLSPTHFRRMFKAETGVTLTVYLKSFRLEEARRLLSSSYLLVKQIMFSVGMKNESHFVREFKKLYGLTPSQYRTLKHNGPAQGRRAVPRGRNGQ